MYFLDTVVTIYGFLFLIAMVITIPLVFAYKVVDSQKERCRKPARISVSIAFVIAGSFFSLGAWQNSLVRDEVKEILDTLPKDAIARVNGEIVNADSLRVDLAKIRMTSGHNSHPVKRYRVVIEDKWLRLDLLLAQDSKRKNEFWAFYSKYRNTRINSFARVNTDYFDKIDR